MNILFTQTVNRIAKMQPDQLLDLRCEVNLNSTKLSDYDNTFGLNPKALQEFFQGYAAYIEQAVLEKCSDQPESRETFFQYFDNIITMLDYIEAVQGGSEKNERTGAI